jgi:hypothetical protein
MTEINYVYDMGDNWQHRIIVEKLKPAESGARYPQFLGGERRCPPEDCGGHPGYRDFLDNIASKQSKKRKGALDWYGGPYDPDEIDEQRIITNLAPRCTSTTFRTCAFRRTGQPIFPKTNLPLGSRLTWKAMELNYWTATEFEGGTYDEREGRWSVVLRRADGTKREMHPRHVVMATGVSGIPSLPDMPTLRSNRGTNSGRECRQRNRH